MKTKTALILIIALACTACVVEHQPDGSRVRRLDPAALQLVRDVYVVAPSASPIPAGK